MTTYTYLNESDLKSCGIEDVGLFIRLIVDAYKLHSQKNYVQPLKLYMRWNSDKNRLNLMPAMVFPESVRQVLGVKFVTSVPDNPKLRQIPRGQSLLILIDSASGLPLAIMAGTKLSAMRTAAMTAVAASKLANQSSTSVGLVGAGPIATTHIPFLKAVLPNLNRFCVFDIDEQRANRMAAFSESQFGIRVQVMASVEECCEGMDIIVPATSSNQSFIENSWLKPGSFLSNIGVFEPKVDVITHSDLVVVDDLAQCLQSKRPFTEAIESGAIRRESVIEIGDILTNKKTGRTEPGQRIFYNPIGLGMLDVMCAAFFLNAAHERQVGTKLELAVDIYNEFLF